MTRDVILLVSDGVWKEISQRNVQKSCRTKEKRLHLKQETAMRYAASFISPETLKFDSKGWCWGPKLELKTWGYGAEGGGKGISRQWQQPSPRPPGAAHSPAAARTLGAASPNPVNPTDPCTWTPKQASSSSPEPNAHHMQPSRTVTTLRLAISEPQRVNGPQMGPRPQVAFPQRSSTTSRESDSGLGRGAPQAHTTHSGTPTHALLQLESPLRHPRRTPTATTQPSPTNSPRHWLDFRHTPPRPAGAWTYFAELRPRGSALPDGGQHGSEAFVRENATGSRLFRCGNMAAPGPSPPPWERPS